MAKLRAKRNESFALSLISMGRVLILCVGAIVGVLQIDAQVTTADILGTVTDTTGAVVPDATISITNLETKIRATAKTNGTGDYVFNLLVPGQYEVAVQAKGFKKVVFPNIAIAAGDRQREDAKLEPGSTAETVEVNAAPPLLQTDSAAVSSVVTEESVQDLPLNGRNYINLVQIQPGVNQGSPNAVSSGARPDDRRQSSTVSANGQSDLFNNQMIDGMDNNEREQGFIGVRPSIDAIAEVKVDTNAYNAEIGRSAGAVVDIITKSGTDAYHGSAYEYFRNDTFDARDFFSRVGVTPKPEYRLNQFGGSLGGPIIKNKTFFFVDAEDYRNIQGQSSGLLTVPTAYEQANPGDFTDVGGPFVPPAYLDPVGLAYFKMYPLPNIPGAEALNNYSSVEKYSQYALSVDGRIDHHFNNGDTFFARYSYNNVDTSVPGYFPATTVDNVSVLPGGSTFGFFGNSNANAQGIQFNFVHMLRPNLLLELKAGYTRINIDTGNLNEGKDISSAIGLVNVNTPAAPETSGLMPLYFLAGNYAGLGDSPFLPILDINNTFQYAGAVTYTHGAHNIKIGDQLIRRQLNYFQSPFPLATALYVGLTGNVLEDVLTGLPLGYIRENTLIKPGYRTWENGLYVQDDWRVSSKLTLNLGLRYDIYTPITEAHNRYANFEYPTLTLIQGSQDPQIGVNTSFTNFAPRVGFAASVSKDTVVRGGYGISYYPIAIQGQIQAANPPFAYANTCVPCFGTGFKWPTFPTPVPSSTTNLSGDLTYLTKNFNTAYTQEFNLMVQQAFGANVITIGGLGELSRHQLFQPYINIPDPTGPYPNGATTGPSAPPAVLTASVLPNVSQIQMDSTEGATNYYALQAVFARRFTKGLAFNANYTWAHGLSDSISGSSGNFSVQGLLPRNPRYDYGNSAVDIRDRIAASGTYELPFGKNATGASALFVKGWTANLLTFWQTGQPFTVSDSFTNSYGVAQINLPTITSDRPSVTGRPYRAANPSISNSLNLAAFTPQPAGTPGNEANNQLYGPHTRRVDISVFKTFDLSEKYSLQFRAECFNISNTPNFSSPNAAISAWTEGPEHTATTPISKVGLLPGDTPASGTTFGTITSTAYGINPRQFQFALKLLF